MAGEQIQSTPKILKNERAEVEKPQERRARMEYQDLRVKLFKLFQAEAKWSFRQLRDATNQPDAWLKEVLLEIADIHKGGPDKGLYELKEYLK